MTLGTLCFKWYVITHQHINVIINVLFSLAAIWIMAWTSNYITHITWMLLFIHAIILMTKWVIGKIEREKILQYAIDYNQCNRIKISSSFMIPSSIFPCLVYSIWASERPQFPADWHIIRPLSWYRSQYQHRKWLMTAGWVVYSRYRWSFAPVRWILYIASGLCSSCNFFSSIKLLH